MKKMATKSFALRIEGPLVKPLQELKKQNRRSLNAEINAALEAWVAAANRQVTTPEVASLSSAEPSRTEAAPSRPRAKRPSKRKSANVRAQAETEADSESAVASESPAA
jgi:hypothetical protein